MAWLPLQKSDGGFQRWAVGLVGPADPLCLAQALYSGVGAAGGALALRALKGGAPWDSWHLRTRSRSGTGFVLTRSYEAEK